MNWADLRYVLAVGRHGSFAAAGRTLGVDATTAGRRILALESGLKCRLFDRTPDGLVATAAGETAIAHAEAMERQALGLEQQLAGANDRIAGPVRITGLDGFFDHFLIPRLKPFRDTNPDIEIELSSDIRMLDLSRREADIAIRTVKPVHPDAVATFLGKSAGCAYAAVHASFGSVPPVIGWSKSLAGTIPDLLLVRHFPNSRIAARVNNEGHALSLARAGFGVALIECFMGDVDPQLRRWLDEPILMEDVWAVTHVEMRYVPRVRAVLDFLKEIFAGNADLLAGKKPQPAADTN